MTFTDFKNSVSANASPGDVSIYLQALWYDAKGDWREAHTLIQDIPDNIASQIHAYLHRKEGDAFNADYWYRKAGKERPAISLQKEWEALVNTLL